MKKCADNIYFTMIQSSHLYFLQIDLVGVPTDGATYLIGSCKYRNEETDLPELMLLQEYAKVFGKGKNYYYYIFSKAGFTEKLLEYGQDENIRLITLEQMYDF